MASSRTIIGLYQCKPISEKLVRTTRRLSDELNAEWFAVHVNVTSKPELDPENLERIGKTLQLAEELGARTRTLNRTLHP